MKRLILTSSSGSGLAKSELAEIVVFFFFRFAWGPLPSSEYFAAYFGARSETLRLGDHWSDWGVVWPRAFRDRRNLPLADFCERYDEIELWFDPTPEAQLQLIWLLDYLGSCPKLLAKLRLRLLASDLFELRGEELGKSASRISVVDVTAKELETAKMAWQAYCAPTPEACADLLRRDLSALLMLRPALVDLLAELPSPLTGLGATEMRFLELLARGFANTNALFHLRSQRRTYVFGEFELGSLLEGLALGPRPVVAGLGDELRTIDRENLRARHEVYLRSRLSLTEFGRAVLAHQEDFSRYNPIDRWWGGTRLTNDRLWRYGSVLTKP
ncbi:hypothetical protein QCM77_16270 [Bradyrhizobium sp. SSUT18]|uniref:hypothetical protein n=1 Tax=unclassified Bradyrhizobium TaxID=2631580 RepID=UPI0024469E48|nr:MULTISPECIES: hypothetical protein [unclassified Bradyrhizobium]MDH2350622.1 hypothetical protein [Bradyrhizobium sp. SSUT112]MDH2401498.1 hypothetical protein [Bradyrhizobium sp. SSUT18]